jgi:hypothetical protein
VREEYNLLKVESRREKDQVEIKLKNQMFSSNDQLRNEQTSQIKSLQRELDQANGIAEKKQSELKRY